MEKKYGVIKKVYIPNDNKNDVMISNKIGFIIEIDNRLYKYEIEQNEEICEIMKNDKKNSFGKINLILPIDFGKVEITDNIDEDEILKIIKGANHA